MRGLVPRPTLSQLTEAVRLGCHEFNRFGITSVIDPGLYPWELHAYQAAYEAGILSVRLNVMPSWHGFREEEQEAALDSRAAELGIYTGLGDEWLRIGGLKMAIDGGTSSHTACMYEPFEGETEVKSFNRLDTADLRRHFRRAARYQGGTPAFIAAATVPRTWPLRQWPMPRMRRAAPTGATASSMLTSPLITRSI